MSQPPIPASAPASNRKMRERVLVLRKRLAWLEARVAINGDGLSYDRQEASALKWAISELVGLYPDLADVTYEGDL